MKLFIIAISWDNPGMADTVDIYTVWGDDEQDAQDYFISHSSDLEDPNEYTLQISVVPIEFYSERITYQFSA